MGVLLTLFFYLPLTLAAAVAAALLGIAAVLRCRRARYLSSLPPNSGPVLGVFHPYCNAGGGGERVLWVALQALEQRAASSSRPITCHIYTGDSDATPEAILAKAKSRFFVDIQQTRLAINFVYITSRGRIEAARYPRFTMLGQSLGSMWVAVECLWRQPAGVFLDTTGCAFTYLVARAAGCRVASYTHYPTITQDMLNRVHARRPSYNNDDGIANSTTLTTAKLVYYRLFALAYKFVGKFTHVNMVNSNWTRGHITSLWRGAAPAQVVFPPCNTDELQQAALGGRRRVVVSVGQFRPEKDHFRQLEAFAKLKAVPRFGDVKMEVIGGARDAGDKQRVADLKARAAALGVDDSVVFMVNAPFADLRRALETSMVGLHTMWNEHFGIGVVEMMAAGVVPIAHRSGGPLTDIVVPVDGKPTGFLADTPQEYADAMAQVFDLATSKPQALEAQVARARASVERFSDAAFGDSFLAAMKPVLE